MKQVDLPMAATSMGLGAALGRLRKSKRAALVSEENGKYHVFSAGSIAVGRSRGIKTLSELKLSSKLKPYKVVSQLPAPPGKVRVSARRLSPLGAGTKRKSAVKPVQVSRSDFVLAKIIGKSAFLGIRSIAVANRFVSSPSDYYCDGPRHHPFPPPDVSVGDRCPRCGHTIVSG